MMVPPNVRKMGGGPNTPLPDWVHIAALMLDFGYTEREVLEEISPAMAARVYELARVREIASKSSDDGGDLPAGARRRLRTAGR